MTFWILTEDTNQLIARSVLRSAENQSTPNLRINPKLPVVEDVKDKIPSMKPPMFDPEELLGKVFQTEHAGHMQRAEIKEQVEDQTYLIEYADGDDERLTYAELINLLNKEEEDSHQLWTFSEILEHRKVIHKGKSIIEVKVKWDTGEPTWEPMNTIRRDDPVTLATYVKDHQLQDQPEWKWARRYIKSPKRFLRYTTQMAKMKRKLGPKFKFGVRVPRNLKEAFILDQENKDTLWKDAILKELRKIMSFNVFRVSPDGKPPEGYKQIPCHIIFDVKHDGRRKARFVAGGHLTLDPGEDSYSGVIAPDAIRLGMFAAIHNNLKVLTADIGNAYLHAKTKEKVYTILGKEYEGLGEEFANICCKVLIFDKSLYGLKTSGARFHEHLSDTLRHLGFKPSKADADLWIKDCKTHYEYIARYVDDILVFSKFPQKILDDMSKVYTLQSIGIPEYYLGGDFKIHKKENDLETYTFGAKTYVTNVCQRIETLLGITLKPQEIPMATNDHPELEDTRLLNIEEHSKYRMLIGCAQWAITLGRIDIMFAVQTLSRFSAAPQEAHLKRILRVFGYLKAHPDFGIEVNTDLHIFPPTQEIEVNWEEQYPCTGEELPYGMPTPRGKPVYLTAYVDADHAHDQVTRRSITGYLLFINNTPIKWYSKRQNTVESSTYGAELVAMRIAVEGIIKFRYKLRMMGIVLQGPSQVLCDNQSVVLNMTLPSSTLKKKHNAIAYHRVREAVAAHVIKVNHIDGKCNIADILTKATDAMTFTRHRDKCLTPIIKSTSD